MRQDALVNGEPVLEARRPGVLKEPASGDTQMFFKLKRSCDAVVRPRVTPDPNQAAELERRINSLAYYPENGFHRDRMQERIDHQRMRRV
nr:hypothetical protein [Gammaproteobacteria bacterium]